MDQFLSAPINTIDHLFQSHIARNGDVDGPPQIHQDQDLGISDLCQQLLESPAQLAKIPILNVTESYLIPDKSLVRYRGMIQDMFDPEYYMGIYGQRNPQSGQRSWRLGKYRDVVEIEPSMELDASHESVVMYERQSCHCIPIPGESTWVKDLLVASQDISFLKTDSLGQTQRAKRRLEGESNPESFSEQADNPSDRPIRPRLEDSHGSGSVGASTLPAPLCLGVIAKIYSASVPVKINDLVEFIGVYYRQGPIATEESDGFFENSEGYDEFSLPRIHVFHVRKIESESILIYPRIQSLDPLTVVSSINIPLVRQSIVGQFAQILRGDQLAAEYFLLNILSRIYARKQDISLGKYSLNIHNAQPEWSLSERISDILKNISQRTQLLHLTIDGLNTHPFIPYKDYEKNRLMWGLLQLGLGTNLIVDECTLLPGQLGEKGVANYKALQELSLWQKVDYNFQYHSLSFYTDIPMVIVSTGKSLIQTDIAIPLVPSEPILTPQCSIDDVRAYLINVRLLECKLDENTAKVAEGDYVRLRQSDPNINQQDFHNMLTLARISAVSHGEVILTPERWQRIVEMETLRRRRFA
eukprot:TRINITY_DN9219_c0_g1_i1.p1 TRINITY_DN9219_c0_g1~~TRINITY_DN9219_c0_g1_i1.p1  ORF type:complete len:585 (-),score=115.65 TRINITY_DN9219_c0_g1_i1:48-1802(-)